MQDGPKNAQMSQPSDPEKRQLSLTQPEPKVNKCGMPHIGVIFTLCVTHLVDLPSSTLSQRYCE